MNYFDDILNVYAHLSSKAKKAADTTRNLARKAAGLDSSFQELNTQADSLLADADALLAKAYALADALGVDTTGLSPHKSDTELDLPEPVSGSVSADIRIPIPINHDYHNEFQKLVSEAHEAGFIDVHPEELLTREEMAHAEAFSDQLDAEFRAATKLQPKDLVVLLIAVAVRVLVYFLSRKIQAIRSQNTAQDSTQESAAPAPQVLPPESTAPLNASPASFSLGNAPAMLPINAAQGVDINGMLGNLSNHSNAVNTGQSFVDKITDKFVQPVRILDHTTILEQNTPFDIQDTDLFQKDDIVAYHKYLGWIIGTLNILTDTITTYNLKSYTITRPMPGIGKPCVNQEISTIFSVINPVMQSAGFYKDSVAAAAVQEALTQGFGKASAQDVRTLFGRAMELENKTASFTEEAKGILSGFNAEWAACVGDIAGTALINTIVSAVHAILYEEKDGSLDTYSIRTNTIILYSSAMATVINSLPAIASKNIADLDFAGILTSCISLFQSTKFWIEAKTAFLVSAYKPALDQELAKLDQYFQYE